MEVSNVNRMSDGLWSRLRDFRRDELEAALTQDRVLKATLMRGTLHLVSARDFDCYRAASRNPNHVYTQMVQQLHERGIDVEAIRTEIIAAVQERPLKRMELRTVARHRVPDDMPEWAAWSTVALSGDLINLAEDARFGYFGGSRYRLAPSTEGDRFEALRHVARAYFESFGPATRADLAQWSGQPVSVFAEALDSLDLLPLRTEDGRTLFDLPKAPRPDLDAAAPVGGQHGDGSDAGNRDGYRARHGQLEGFAGGGADDLLPVVGGDGTLHDPCALPGPPPPERLIRRGALHEGGMEGPDVRL